MSDTPVQIGELSDNEPRNLIGWLLVGAIAFLLISNQLSSYLTRNPSIQLQRARVEDRLRQYVESGISLPTARDSLKKAASELRPKIADDPETTFLYAALATEINENLAPGELSALRFSSKPIYKSAYEVYSSKTLSLDRAKELVRQIPEDSFLNKLVRAQAFQKANNQQPREDLKKSTGTMFAGLAAIVGLLFLGALLWTAYISSRLMGLLTPKGVSLAELSPPDADRVAMRCSQCLLIFVGAGLIAGLALSFVANRDFRAVLIYPVMVGLILAISKLPVGGKIISLQAIGIKREHVGRHILWGTAGAIANVPLLLLVTVVTSAAFRSLPPPEHPVTVELSGPVSLLSIVLITMAASVFAPFIEEITFRGLLFPALSSVLKSPIWGALISSFIFAAIHPTGIPAWPALATIGAMSCFLAYQTKSLVPSMVMHAVHNFGTLMFTLLLLR